MDADRLEAICKGMTAVGGGLMRALSSGSSRIEVTCHCQDADAHRVLNVGELWAKDPAVAVMFLNYVVARFLVLRSLKDPDAQLADISDTEKAIRKALGLPPPADLTTRHKEPARPVPDRHMDLRLRQGSSSASKNK